MSPGKPVTLSRIHRARRLPPGRGQVRTSWPGMASVPAPPTRTGCPYYLLHCRRPRGHPLPLPIPARRSICRRAHPLRHAGGVRQLRPQRGRRPKPARSSCRGGPSSLAPHNPDDDATGSTADQLVAPLADRARSPPTSPTSAVETFLQAEPRTQIGRIAGRRHETPALLFTASHGMGFPNGDPRQLPHQGALLCQDWPGPEGMAQADPRGLLLRR